MACLSRCILSLSLLTTALQIGAQDFDCEGAKQLVRELKRGPDGIVKRIDRDAMGFVNGTVAGWQCMPIPSPPERNGRVYLEALECIYITTVENPTQGDLAEAGRLYQKNLKSIFQCFPKSTNSVPILEAGLSQGDGILITTGDEIRSPAGEDYQILFEYSYFIDGDTPLFWKVAARIGSNSADNPDEFCPTLTRVVNESSRGFIGFRGEYDLEFDEYQSALRLPSSESCQIEKDEHEYTYKCSWHVENDARMADRVQKNLKKLVSKCLGSDIKKLRERESSGTDYTTYYLQNEKKRIRLTHGSRVTRSGEEKYTTRIYVEYDRD